MSKYSRRIEESNIIRFDIALKKKRNFLCLFFLLVFSKLNYKKKENVNIMNRSFSGKNKERVCKKLRETKNFVYRFSRN